MTHLVWTLLYKEKKSNYFPALVKEKYEAQTEIYSMMQYDQEMKMWLCNSCDYLNARKEVLFKHIDSKHYDVRYKCEFCSKLCPTQHSLSEHNRAYHKQY